VDGQIEPLAQGGDERAPRRAAAARHVLDREDVRAGFDDLLGEAQVVVQRVELLRRVSRSPV
jgi:tRNA C32,U32 (ribose-2'-O)-methylase TrmJ